MWKNWFWNYSTIQIKNMPNKAAYSFACPHYFYLLWLTIKSPLECETKLSVCIRMHVDGYDFYNNFKLPLPQPEYQNFSNRAMRGNKLRGIIKEITESEGTAPWCRHNQNQVKSGKLNMIICSLRAQGSHSRLWSNVVTIWGSGGSCWPMELGVWTSVHFSLL